VSSQMVEETRPISTLMHKENFAYECLHPGGRGERVDVALVTPSRRAPPCGDACRVTSERSRQLTRYAGASPQAALCTVSVGPCRLGSEYAQLPTTPHRPRQAAGSCSSCAQALCPGASSHMHRVADHWCSGWKARLPLQHFLYAMCPCKAEAWPRTSHRGWSVLWYALGHDLSRLPH